MTNTKNEKVNQIKAWYLKKKFFMQAKPKIICWEVKDRKYIAIIKCGWRGKKWERRFEVVNEINSKGEPIPFPGAKIQDD